MTSGLTYYVDIGLKIAILALTHNSYKDEMNRVSLVRTRFIASLLSDEIHRISLVQAR
ncbi:hypothetical protein [Nostoc sp. ChiVER01]|uniref:hypothetical protein n=1 Tax=Nostoc sp. ChiVER01 TaxID=3075382 RepID=UPI002AD3C522|nr:hypothetical protein [Nostoc sp. ChiVER01]MDZ8222776.1 hypothetical protein [Nostoc sp. ChiVER01]